MLVPDTSVSLKQCQICGVPAQYYYFGVLACNSCKMFFKRNAHLFKSKLHCDFDDRCEINVCNRHICASCRLQKCFQCGMREDKFRPSRTKQSKDNHLVRLQSERSSTAHLLQSDQWRLLSNLLDAYEEQELLSLSQRLIDADERLEFSDVIYQELVEEFLECIYQTAGRYFNSDDDFTHLSYDHRAMILRGVVSNVSCGGFGFITHQCHLFHLDTFRNSMTMKYDHVLVDMHRRASKYLHSDVVVNKLAIALLAVSNTSCSSLDNLRVTSALIFQLQNKYVDVIWKYLLYKYDYQQAVKIFLNLTIWLMTITALIVHAQTSPIYVNGINSLVEQIELTFILDDMDQTG